MRPFFRFSAAVLTAAVSTLPTTAAPADSADLQALREQVRTLEQQLKVISRQIEIREEAATAVASTTPKITINDKGFTLASADAANWVKLRGLVQLDSRLFFNDGGGVVNNAFVLRRARLISEAQFAKNYGFQFITEFGGTSVSVLDANFTVALDKALLFKVGKFKSPVGLELLQSDAWTFFNERSLVTNLVPNRDLGVQASGDLFNGTLSYQLGVFNGLGDGASSTNADFDNEKDVVARLWASPFKNDAGSFVQGFSFGVSGSFGREKTAAGRTAGYRTDG
jgi:phosphate-selective porin OprO/OprP